MEIVRMTKGNRIAQRRTQLGMSQEDLADMLSTHQRQISRYERDENDPTGDVLVGLAHALHTSTDWILGLTDDVSPAIRVSDLNQLEQMAVRLLRDKSEETQQKMIQILKVL
jgi:transcriptional regulator with XRE-family HTH domain